MPAECTPLSAEWCFLVLPPLCGAVGGAVGAFVRETAHLYRHLERQGRISKSHVVLLAFLPIWVTSGALIGLAGGVLGELEVYCAFYMLLVGAGWRGIAVNTLLARKLIALVAAQIADHFGQKQ